MKSPLKFLPFLTLLLLVDKAAAIPPPDMVLTVIQSLMQIFGVITAFALSTFFFMGDYIKTLYNKSKSICILGIGGTILGLFLFLIYRF